MEIRHRRPPKPRTNVPSSVQYGNNSAVWAQYQQYLARTGSRQSIDRELGRRDFLERAAKFVTATVAAAATFNPPDVQAQIRARFRRSPIDVAPPPDPGVQRMVTKDDFEFIGFYRFPNTGSGAPGLSGADDEAFGFRKLNGELRILMDGAFPNFQTHQFRLPAAAPSLTLTTSTPSLIWEHNWGDIRLGKMRNEAGNIHHSIFPGGFFWDEEKNGLWWSYAASYIQNNNTTHSFTSFNDVSGVATSYGTWRTKPGGVRTARHMHGVPEAFADAYLNGRRLGMVTAAAGGANQSQGPSFISLDIDGFDPFLRPDNLTVFDDNPTWDLDGSVVLYYDADHRHPTGPWYYRKCVGFGVEDDNSYRCFVPAIGGEPTFVLSGPNNLFGMPNPADGTNDQCVAGLWIDLPDRRGYVTFGQFCATNPRFTVPNGDDYIHRGYAALYPGTTWGFSSSSRTCCHGQVAVGASSSPGPVTCGRIPMVWLYDPNDMIPLALGGVESHAITANEFFFFEEVFGLEKVNSIAFQAFARWGFFDKSSRRIYIPITYYDDTRPSLPNRPAIAVFQIN